MSVRPQIDDPQGVQDPRVTSILRTIKTIIDAMTGRKQNQGPIVTLGPDATLAGVINKVNEVIGRLNQ